MANNPFAEKPKLLSPPPSEELVQGFQENWTLKSNNNSPQKVSLKIESMEFKSNRYLNKYEGTVTQNNQSIPFKVNMDRGDKGEVNSIHVEMSAKNTPVVVATWKKMAGVNPDDSFKQFRNAVPVPILAGPRSTTDINGVHLSEAPIKTNENGGISLNQIPPPSNLNSIANQSHRGIELTASAPATDKSSFSLGTALRNFSYILTGKMNDVNAMRSQLNTFKNNDPKVFALAAGFRDPNHIPYKDLKVIFNSNKIQATQSSETPSKTKGFRPINFAWNTAKSILKGTLRTAGSIVGVVFKMPAIKQAWTATRYSTGVAMGVLSGDIFRKSKEIIFDSKGPAVITINGIKNNSKAAEDINNKVKTAFGIQDATIIKNETFLLGIGDVIQILGHELFGAYDKPTLDTVKAIRQGIKEKGEVYVVAHSQGSGIAKQALSLLTTEERSKIHYLGLGPQWIIDSKADGLASAQNIWNKWDPVPTLGNRLRMITNNLFPSQWGRTETNQVKRTSAKGKWTHGFRSYEKFMQEWVIERRNQWATSGNNQYF